MNISRVLLARSMVAIAIVATLALLPGQSASADQRQQIVEKTTNEAKALDPNFSGFSADRGKALFLSKQATGKPDTPSCTSCHSSSPLNVGETRAGKKIAPMALSKSPERYGDLEKVEKWFRRNCNSVLGRACTPVEQGDYLTFMFSQ